MSPALSVKRQYAEKSRERILTDAEIRRFWFACDAIGYPFGPAAQMMLLTGQRRGEVCAMTWAELALEHRVWNLPASRTKNGRAHQVPLSDAAIELIKSRPHLGPGGFVFTTKGTHPVQGYGPAKSAVDDHMKPNSPWVIHDLRRTMATGMHEIGVAPHIVEAVLNNVSGHRAGVAGGYNHATYANEKRAAWARGPRPCGPL